jgi:hypothetical protein
MEASRYPASLAPSESALDVKPYSGTRFSAAERIAVCVGGKGSGSGWCSEWYERHDPLRGCSSRETLGECGRECGTESSLLQVAEVLAMVAFMERQQRLDGGHWLEREWLGE